MNNIGEYIKNPSTIMFGVVRRIAPFFRKDVTYLRLLYYLRFKKKINLDNPRSFSEKIQWLKLYNRKPEYTMMVDKYAVKEYVANIIGADYVIPSIGVWDKPEEIDWTKLPNKFVLKTTHGGGSVGVEICRNKDTFDKKRAINNLNKSLKQDVFTDFREWPYKNVKKRIIAEPLLEANSSGSQDLLDYKFFCFNGEPKLCQVISGRNKKMSIDFYDKDWNHQDFHEPREFPFSKKKIEAPQKYKQMLVLASKLSQGHPFLRVDFYEVRGRIFFGELTFYPTSGLGGFEPDDWDNKIGEWLKLPV